jgi:biotin--protein ligase
LKFASSKNGEIYPFPEPLQDTKASLSKVDSLDGNIAQAIYEGSHAKFLDCFDEHGIEILGRYIDGDKNGRIAGLGCDVGKGRIALWSPNPEQSLTEELASALSYSFNADVLAERERERIDLLRRTFTYLGLQLLTAEARPVARPFPQFLVASPNRPDVISRIIVGLSESFERVDSPNDDVPRRLKDANDTFHFHESTSPNTSGVLADCKALLSTSSDPSTWQPKRVIIHRDGTLPSRDYTDPYFDIEAYFQHLQSLNPPTTQTTSGGGWPIGSVLLFSPAVTSTQTLLDKNPVYLSSLLTPTVSLASHQLIGRGRGSNVWLSPAGSLSTSIHLRLKSTDGVPWNKLVFVQYLYALAICIGVRDNSVLGLGGDEGGEGEGWRVRIKWPNDVYALVGPRGAEEKKKIAGILVNTSFSAGGVDIIVGRSSFVSTVFRHNSSSRVWVKRVQRIASDISFATLA